MNIGILPLQSYAWILGPFKIIGSNNLPKGTQNLDQDWLHRWSPEHHEIVRPLIQILWRTARWWEQSIQPGVGPCVAAQVTCPWPGWSAQAWPCWLWDLECSLPWLSHQSHPPWLTCIDGDLLPFTFADGIFFLGKPPQVYFQHCCTITLPPPKPQI